MCTCDALQNNKCEEVCWVVYVCVCVCASINAWHPSCFCFQPCVNIVHLQTDVTMSGPVARGVRGVRPNPPLGGVGGGGEKYIFLSASYMHKSVSQSGSSHVQF